MANVENRPVCEGRNRASATAHKLQCMAAPGASRFTQRYTQAQKAAILRSVLEEGRSVSATIKLAGEGKLDVPAFKIDRYAYQLVREGRDVFEATSELALANAVDAELKALEIAAVQHSRAIRKKLRGDGTDTPSTLADAAKSLSAIRKAKREANTGFKPPAQGKAQSQTEPTEPKTPDVLAGLLDAAPKHKANGSARTG